MQTISGQIYSSMPCVCVCVFVFVHACGVCVWCVCVGVCLLACVPVCGGDGERMKEAGGEGGGRGEVRGVLNALTLFYMCNADREDL